MNSIFEKKEILIPISVVGTTVICVDRTVHIPPPRWAEKEMHPELRGTGPKEYNKLLLWKQKGADGIKGYEVYDYLKKTDSLKNCLSLEDGKMIQKLGAPVFRKLFEFGATLYLWQSVIKSLSKNKDGTDCLFVAYICAGKKKVLLDWNCLNNKFSLKDLAVQFGEN